MHYDDILKITLVATTSNSWFHYLHATTYRSQAGIIQLRTTICNTKWSSPIRTTIRIYHKSISLTGFDCEGQSSETLRTSHN